MFFIIIIQIKFAFVSFKISACTEIISNATHVHLLLIATNFKLLN